MLAVEWGTGQVLWSLLWFFLFFMWIMLVVTIFVDLVRADMSGWAKALWTLAIIILPFLGVFLYLIVNGSEMGARSERDAARQQEAVDDYIRETAATSSSDELAKLGQLHTDGKLTDSEYAAAKAKVLAG
jgi:hypothetical protein